MARRRGVIREFFLFVKERKAYWLVPIILVLLLLILLIIAGPAGLAPLIYPVF